MINKILIENKNILANVFFQASTNQINVLPLHIYVIESNIIRIIYNLIATESNRDDLSHKRHGFNRRHAAQRNRGLIIDYYASRIHGAPKKIFQQRVLWQNGPRPL
jgi:hypothetical protein